MKLLNSKMLGWQQFNATISIQLRGKTVKKKKFKKYKQERRRESILQTTEIMWVATDELRAENTTSHTPFSLVSCTC